MRGPLLVAPHTEMKRGDTGLVRVETALLGENGLEATLHDARIATKSKEMRQHRPNARRPQHKCWPCALLFLEHGVVVRPMLGSSLGKIKATYTLAEGNLLRYGQLNSIPLVRSAVGKAPYLYLRRHATLPSSPWSCLRRWCCHLSRTSTKWCSHGTRASRSMSRTALFRVPDVMGSRAVSDAPQAVRCLLVSCTQLKCPMSVSSHPQSAL